jgi:type VI secretion system protein ImpC
MTGEEAFLQAILTDPEDDAPRLVYADWLEEHGEAARADFIRVQCELARAGGDPEWRPDFFAWQRELARAEDDPPRVADLKRRERELLDRFGAAWGRPLVERGWARFFVFRRGLPDPSPPMSGPWTFALRVSPKYSVGSSVTPTELPFVIGVLADLTAYRREGVLPLDERQAQAVDRDSFHQLLAQCRPQLHLEVPRPAEEGGGRLPLDLDFERLMDFAPGRLAERVPELRRRLDGRRRRAAEGAGAEELAALDRRLSSLLAAVLHHPDFRRLEATWRGLHYLVNQAAETGNRLIVPGMGTRLIIRVLNVSKSELSRDTGGAAAFDQTDLYQHVYAEQFCRLGGEPYGLLVGDYEFGRGPEDVRLLRSIARLAAHAHAPFVAAASPALFGVERFSELPAGRELARAFEGEEAAAWRAFRESEDARYVALTLPRVLARPPYPREATAWRGGEGAAGPLWMSAAWAYAANVAGAFVRFGWAARTCRAGGGRVEGLPAYAPTPAEGGPAASGPCEVALSGRSASELSDFGFLALAQNAGLGWAAFPGAASCGKPPPQANAAADAEAGPPARLDQLLCLSRFLHALVMQARDRIGSFMEISDCERNLMRWLSDYVTPPGPSGEGVRVRGEVYVAPGPAALPGKAPVVAYFRKLLIRWDARFPLAEARLQVQPIPGQRFRYQVEAWLRPAFQFTVPTATARLIAEVPPLGGL